MDGQLVSLEVVVVVVVVFVVVVVVVVVVRTFLRIITEQRLKSLWSGGIPQGKTQANQAWYTHISYLAVCTMAAVVCLKNIEALLGTRYLGG